MRKTALIILISCLQLSNIFGQWQNYKTFIDCSKPIHPKLVHLKGNVKTIVETTNDFHFTNNQNHFYTFENKKIVSDSFAHRCEYYFYDKYGYLKEIKNSYQTITYVSDSVTHQVINVHFGAGKEMYNFTFEYSKEKVIEKLATTVHLEYELNTKGLISRYADGYRGWVEYEYDEKNNLLQRKVYNISGECNYVSTFDNFDNLIYYGCENDKEKPPYIYNDIDYKGNWTSGISSTPNFFTNDKPISTSRIYTYYE